MKRACLCTQNSGSNLIEEVFGAVKKYLNKEKKEKIIGEVQKHNKTKKETTVCSVISCQK